MASTINLKFPSLASITSELIFLLCWLHCDAMLTGCDITSDSPVWPMGSHAVKWATDCQAAGQLERILGQKGLQRKKNLHQRTFTSNHQNTGWFTDSYMYSLHVLWLYMYLVQIWKATTSKTFILKLCLNQHFLNQILNMQVFKMSDALLSKTQTCIIDMNSRKTFKAVVNYC